MVNKLDELQTRVNNGKVDIIVITEALPKHSSFKLQEQELKIKGFASISNFDCAHEQNGRGIIIYVMDGLISVKREVKVSFNEHLVVDITLPSKKEIILAVFYRSPNSSDENSSRLFRCISDVANIKSSSVIMLGDFNLPRINWATCIAPLGSYEERFIDCLMDNFLCQHVREYTRMREGQKSTILDLALTKDEEYTSDIDISDHLRKSDHLIMKITVNESLKKYLNA